MGTKKKKTTNRVKLSKQKILEAAVGYADEHGVEALSMRKIADRLGCGVMSLYNHVANKDEMIVEMVDCILAPLEPPSLDVGWKEALRSYATAAHRVLLEHRWASAEWTRRMPGPGRIALMDGVLRILTEGGLKKELVYQGYHAVTMHLVGYTLQQVSYEQVMFGEDFEQLAHQFLDSLEDNYPYMTEHVRAHLTGECDGDEFCFVLDLILDGLEGANAP